ncbi:peptidase M16 [Clostridium sp. MF28]|uniref:Peptidase M16 n=1 Tax=Clostridium diolis TaxID=223919 RepID=A0AAV3VUT1_9CLOT|nr:MULTISPECIES: pitrilysin family protein [Clostridium]ALB44691.1 insulinase family protein [Clostridium beijerinckii NRRL B-598]AVK48142.1 peptidase M16 [Clostridium sp. MF28]OVE70575.1 peptidase M16 [Clostridium diolis]PSM58486.1 insulinase family protein [Clostridium diolis]QES75185.1 insulinase family protein [Clostridium diolis]
MEEYILENDLRLIYKHTDSELSSICISLNAGAGVEKEKFGVAHATEHMVYKGTKNRTEREINEELSNIFGFNNAMTNYPYVIYYGTLLGEDLQKGVEILSDIIINPEFGENGFKEEMDVIKEELKEWDEDVDQYCEDNLFFNCFNNRRIKYPIIGTFDDLENITLDNIKEFYDKYYFPGNTSIVIISSVKFDIVKEIIYKHFFAWKKKNIIQEGISGPGNKKLIEYENPQKGTYNNVRGGIRACKVEMIFPIDDLSEKEIKALRIFNQYFGEGVNSILYDVLRTQNGLVYDVLTKISHENYIKLYKITFSTSEENVNKAISLIEGCIAKLDLLQKKLDNDQIERLIKSFKLKRLFREEQSIILAKELATYDCMFRDYKIYINEIKEIELLTKEMIFQVGRKVLKNFTTQIIERA